MAPPPILSSLLLLLHTLTLAAAAAGRFDLLLPSIGISAMHMQLLHTDRVIIFDRTDFGPSNISLPDGHCRTDPNDTALTRDCTAHSVEYDVIRNSVRPLTVLTDTWCSSGGLSPDGLLIQTGGYNDGDHAIRTYDPTCTSSPCDWVETNPGLTNRRWYATNHVLPDGSHIIVGGRRQFNYEFYPKTSPAAARSYNLPFLVQTNDPKIENNLYPFVFLHTDGNLFIFANNRSILFDYVHGSVVRTYPPVPGGDPRSYPSTGSAVLLPFQVGSGPEILVCGGAPRGAYASGNFMRALNTCGRIRIDDHDPKWVVETMPGPRVMGDMVLLPNGDVLIINGAGSGTAGWESGRDPVFTPVIYRPGNSLGSRFEVQASSSVPRMYHSTAVLLRDGRVLVGGSNPHIYYNFTGVMYPTDLSLEAFSPAYLSSSFTSIRPRIVSPVSQSRIGYGQRVGIHFTVPSGRVDGDKVMVTMVSPPFTTHSFSMNQRLLVLSSGNVTANGNGYDVRVVMPGSGNVAPPGYYLLFVVHQQVPSEGIWVKIK
ncbi:glyoxal oxidase-related protein [Striga hermonthica]|uniref:Aldehyde oxidase GLOX n=1 Tax=Striga hermonthica TaxID=68872 RepID=A0A9N7NYL7_STRHE|nr:glyoxal oxidase-related protein [Striga hermonthica]